MLTNLVIIVGTIAAIVAAFASVKALFPRAKPSVANPKITINLSDHGLYNAFIGSFIAVNGGPKLCSLKSVRVSMAGLTYEADAIAERMILEIQELGRRGGELPISITGYEQKTVSFRGTHSIRDKEALPPTLSLEVKFNCETIQQELTRIRNTLNYE